jgi:hypothetical protein
MFIKEIIQKTHATAVVETGAPAPQRLNPQPSYAVQEEKRKKKKNNHGYR